MSSFLVIDTEVIDDDAFAEFAAKIYEAVTAQGGTFLVRAQALQCAQGQPPRGAGSRNGPLAATMRIRAPRCPAIAQRVGTRATISGGLLLAGAGLGIMAALTPDSDYWLMVIALVTTAAGLSLFMPSSTHIIVTSLPHHKAGVGSAVNDTTREVGASIGIAVMGTLLAVGYRGGMRSQAGDLPEEAAEVAGDSIGAALRVARDLPAERAARLTESAVDAFNRGMTLAMGVAAALLALTAAATYLLHPRDPAGDPGESNRAQ